MKRNKKRSRMKAKRFVSGAIAMIAVGGIAFAAGVSEGQDKKTRNL
jgi:hypothetical protein